MPAFAAVLPYPNTLADALCASRRGRQRTLATDVMMVVGASLLVALSAQVSIHLPFTPVPITGQTFGVLLAGMLLGSRRAAAALILYLFEGAACLPFFAGGHAGVVEMLGPAGGYLWSYPVVAALVGYLSERGWDRRMPTALLAMALGGVFILTVGSLWLSFYVGGIGKGFLLGFAPFVIGDTIKTILAAALLPTGWKVLERIQGK